VAVEVLDLRPEKVADHLAEVVVDDVVAAGLRCATPIE